MVWKEANGEFGFLMGGVRAVDLGLRLEDLVIWMSRQRAESREQRAEGDCVGVK
jgi:hypothetical protein